MNVAENKLEKDVEEKEKDESEDNMNKEDIFIQDVGFTVKIVAPGAEPFDIQVNMTVKLYSIQFLMLPY